MISDYVLNEEEIAKFFPQDQPLEEPEIKGVLYDAEGNIVKDPSRWGKAPVTLGEFTGKMLGAGADQVQGLGYGVVGLAGDVVGSDTIKDFGLEGYQRNMQDAAVAREEAGMVDFLDIDGVGSAGKWAYGTLLEQLPQLAPTLALGGAGGLAGRQLVKKGLQEVIEEGVSGGLSRKAAEAAVANAVASRGGAKAFLTGTVDKAAARQLMEGGLSREATEAALGRVAAGKLAPQVGVAAGNIASGQAMSMGSIYGDTEDAGLGLGYGAVAGAIEGLADTVLFSPFAKRAFGVDVAERSAKNKNLLASAGKGFVKGAVVEGPLEEYPQTYIEQLAKLEKDPDYYGPDGIDSERAKRERINAMAAGSVVGGTIGPVGGALEALAPRTKNALQGLVQKPLSDPETGLPPNETDSFTSEAREYEPEAYDIGNGINARRFKIKGTETTGWAIDNPTEAVLKEFGNSGYVDDGKLILTSNSAGNTLAVRGDTARAKALGKIQEDDEQEEQSQEPEKREPLDLTGPPQPLRVVPSQVAVGDVIQLGGAPRLVSSVSTDNGTTTIVATNTTTGAQQTLSGSDKMLEVEIVSRAQAQQSQPPQQATEKPEGKLSAGDALAAVQGAAEIAFRNRMRDRLASGERVVFSRPDSIEAARNNPYYETQDLPDGTVQVVGVKPEIQNQTSATQAAKVKPKAQIPPPPSPIINSTTTPEEIASEIATMQSALNSYDYGLEGNRKIQDEIVALEQEAQKRRAIPATAPGITRGDAWELSQTTLALPEVDIVNAVEDPDETSVSLLDDAQKSLENAITQIEGRDIPQAEKEEATKPLYDKLVQVDEIQQIYTPEKAPSALLTPTTPLEQEVEKQVAEHQQKVAEQKQAQAEALGARTPEQTQGFVASLKPGDNVTVDLDGPNDINGTFEGATDEGQVIVKDKKTRKRQVAPKENVTLTVDLPEAPTKASVVQAKLGDAPSEQTLTGLGFKSTGGTTTERIGDKTFDRPTYTTTEKDKVDQRPLTVTATFYNVNGKATPNYHYVHGGEKGKKKTWTRDILRAMDRGYEARIPNSVEAPAGVQTEAVEGTDYRVVTGVDFTFDGVNFGTFLRGNKGVRHNGREGEGVFAEAWSTNPDYNNIRLQRSKQNTKTRKDRGTDASTRAGQRASALNPIGQSIFQAIFGSPNRSVTTKDDPNADEDERDFNVDISWPLGSFGGRIDSYLRSEASGLDVEGREGFSQGAENKIFNALSISELTDTVDLTPEQRTLVDSTVSAYLAAQRSGEVKFAGKGKLTQATINKLKKDLTPSKADEKLVNRTLNAMQELAMFSNPRTQGAVLSEVASEEYRKQAKRPKGSVSLDQNIGESGDATLADVLDTQGGKANEDDGNLNAAAGELSEEQEATIEEQEKAVDKIVASIDDRIGGIEASSALSELVNSLSPLEKIAYDWISTSDRASRNKFYGQLEDQIEDPNDLIEDLKEKIAGLAQRVSGRTLSPAVRSELQPQPAAPGLEGGVLNRTSKTAEIRRIKRRYIQGKAGLTDEQMLAMADDEIDRAYLAYNARADEARAAKAQDAVVSAAPAIDQLVDLDSASLLSEYARELAQDLKAGEMGKIREANFAELTRLGAFASTREFLSRIADPAYKMPRDMQLRAKAFLDLEKKRGFKLDAIEIQAANFLQTGTQDRASWAGLMGRNADYTSFGIYLNLDQAHDRFSAANTALHELAHVTVLAKKHGKVKLSKDEEKAIADLESMRRRAILRAGDASPTIKAEAEAKGITDPRDRTAFYETRLRELSSTAPEFRDYNGLANLDEFVVEMTGSPDFLDLLRRLGFGGADTDRKSLGGMIRDAFKAILKLVAPGISATSEIGKAFTDSWNLTYAGSKPVVSPGELLQATRGITEVKEAAPVPKKGTKKKAPQGKAAETQTETSTAKTPASVSPTAPQGGKGSVTSDNDKATAQTPESNNQATTTEEKPKRGKGRPTKREMREATALPTSKEAFEAEMAQGEMTPEEREAEFNEAPQSPAAKPRVVKALTDDERDLAERRASNMEDILFYNGITEEDYYTLIGKGILTPSEIEAGYMQDLPKILSNISGDETQPGPLRHVAQMLLDLGFDFSKVRFRVAETADAQAEGGWAGLYRAGTSARSGEISINMDSDHRGGVAQSIVHEALHHVFFWKTQKGYPLNRVERAAFNDLQKIFKQAERAALGRYARGGETIGQARARLAPGDLFYGLTNVDEFITEILTNPEFQVFLQQVPPMQSLPKKGGYIRNLLDQIFSYFRDFIYGRDVSGDSLLTQGLDNVLALIQTPQTESGVQRAMNQMLGEPVARATMPAPMSPAGKIDNAGELNMALEMDRERIFKLLGERMYNADLSNVVVKETVQNSFDAIKDAEATGVIKPGEGKLAYSSERDNGVVKMSFLDNGIGMTPEILQKAFFTVGGSYKVSGKGSGGFGLAKVGMFMSADKVYVETVRDGVLTTADLTKEDLMGSGFKVKTEKTDRKNGTLVQLSFPEKWATSDGKEKEFESPSLGIDKLVKHDLQYFEDRYGYDKGDFQDIVKNFRGEGENLRYWESGRVTFSNLNSVDAIFKGLPKNIPVIQKEFQIDNISLKISAARLGFKDPDGTTKYRQYFKINGTEYDFENSSMVVLSNGLFQFSQNRIVIDPMGSLWDPENKLPYSIVVDVDAGGIDASSTEYPFENNRESLRKGKVENAINSFLGELQAKEKRDAFDNEFKALSGFDGSAPNKDKANFYNNISHTPDENEMALLKDLSQEIFDSANSFVRELRIAAEAGLLSDSENWGRVKLKNDLTSEGTIDYYYGVGLSKNWGGVNTSREPTVVLVNPVYHPKTLERLQSEFGRKLQANHLAHIVAHEVNHALHRNEGAGFTWGLNDTESLISATDSYQESKIKFLRIIEKHADAFRTLKQNYDKSETLNADQELTGSNSRTSEDIPANERLSRNLLGGRDLSNEYQSEVSERSAATGGERASEADSGGQLQRGLQTSGSSNQISLGEALISGRVAAPMSPAGDLKKTVAKLTGQEIITTPSGGTYEKGGLFSTDGKLDKRAGDRWRKRGMRIGAQERMVNLAVQKLVAAVKGERKAGREVSMDLMNTALGNLDNPLTQAQRTEIKRLREIDEEAANAQEGAYMAKNREAFKVKQAEALRQLPTEIAEAVQEMTEHITALSGALKKAGILEPGLAATIDANLGIYLHRSYEIFDNPAHKDKIKKDEMVMTAAENLLRRQIESRNAQKLIDDVAKAGGILSKADAERQARGTAKREEIDRVMEQLLAVGEESLGGVILRGRIPGQKDLSILDARGNIAPEIQALWGRYEDPTINYAKTVMKISTLVANHQFLAETRSLGLQEGWLYEGEDHPPGYLKIASENNKSLAPLSGLYGNRDLVEALYAMYPPAGIAENYEWVKFFAKLTGMSMASKTVLSAASHVRNFAGNFLNLAASGNLGINDILNGGRYKKALDLTIRSTFSNASAQQFKDTIKELVELGVLNESLTAGLLNDLIGTKRVAQNPMEFSDRLVDMLVKKPAAAIWDNAQKSYQSSDEFFKVVIYLSELDKYRKAMPQWSEQQLKENAAKIARDVHWTYSLSPVAVGKIKQFPFIAPFITFTTEVIRTTKNTMELAYREIKEGNRTGNKELAAIGWKRVRGMGVAAFAPSMIAGAIGIQAGISGEDDDDLRRFLPDWQKNSQLLVFKNKDGKVSFVDVSYLDPYEYWKRPITAFLRALGADSESTAMERIAQGAVDAGAQLLNPFAAEQILSGAILDIARNKKESGQELWNPQDTGTRIAAKIGDHLWNAMEPGTLVTGGRIWDAWTGTVSDSGRSYGLLNETLGVALGQRVSELDVEQSLGFKSSQYARNLRDASSLFTREFSNRGTRSADQIMDAYNRANDATFDLGKEFRQDLLSAIRLGKISQKRAQEILSASRLSKEDIKMLRTGRYLRYEPSPQQIKLAKELGNENRIRDARQAERAAATNIPLR